MKEIKTVLLDKYKDSNNYREIGFNVYEKISDKNYCFAFEADKVEQYPLEDLLDQYQVSCTEYYGDKVNINGEEKNVVEVETVDNNIESLIKILNFATIVDKEIININYNQNKYLVKKINTSLFTINSGLFKNTKVEVPIVVDKIDKTGLTNFTVIYPEKQLEELFLNNHKYKIDSNLLGNIEYVMIKGDTANILINKNGVYSKVVVDINGNLNI